MEMSALFAEPDFNFTRKQQIQVALDLSEYLDLNIDQGKRAYISIYCNYQLLQSVLFYPDSASRVLSGVLQDGKFNSAFVGLNNQSVYLVEVWFYDGEQPIQKEQRVNGNLLAW